MSPEKARPISPKDVVSEKLRLFPNEVIEAFNELITQNESGGRSSVRQKEVVALMVSKGLEENEIYKKGWLDVEDIYRKAGWKVEYDKPGYNESYDAYFVFSKPRKNTLYG